MNKYSDSPAETSLSLTPLSSQAAAAFLRHIRHELRTPLNAIIGYSELLLEDVETAEAAETAETAEPESGDDAESVISKWRQDLTRVRDAGHKLIELTGEILGGEQVSGADDHFNLELIAASIRLEMRAPIGTVMGYSDILLEAAHDGAVPDTLDTDAAVDLLERIAAAARRLSGLVEEIIRAAPDGELRLLTPTDESTPISSTPLGATRTNGAEDGVWNQLIAGQGPLQGHLLVVDDNAENRDLLSRRLVRQGYTVAVAEDGQTALTMLRERAFDLVLLDILLPGMDGYEVLETLKQDPQLRHVPVVMISALDQIDSVARCIAIGADDYLPKPFDPVLLRARVNASLEKKRLRDQEVQFFEQLQSNYTRLQELEKMRDSLIHMVVHDLRTPLTSLLAGISTIRSAGALNDLQQECLVISEQSGNTLLRMINDLLDISRMESSALELEYQQLQAPSLVADVLQQTLPLAEKKGQTLQPDVAAALPAFDADGDKLHRVLTNLVGNAIKFTPSGGAITVTARRGASDDAATSDSDTPGDTMYFAVTDTGTGIPREEFGRIFEKFGRISGPRFQQSTSTGLGLTFCKMVVEAHGGRIGVESELNRGSTFWFTIPARATQVSSQATSQVTA